MRIINRGKEKMMDNTGDGDVAGRVTGHWLLLRVHGLI